MYNVNFIFEQVVALFASFGAAAIFLKTFDFSDYGGLQNKSLFFSRCFYDRRFST